MRKVLGLCVVTTLLVACGGERPERGDPLAGSGGVPEGDGIPEGPGFGPVPTPSAPTGPPDTRPVQHATRPPPPISGGTLLVSADASLVVAADPDRDRVSIVDLDTRQLLHTIWFQRGAEPGRVVEDASGRIHVALRRGGAVFTIDPVEGVVTDRREVCTAPRGLAFDAGSDSIHVACMDGRLVTLPAAGGLATRTLDLGVDLRDVVVRESGGLWVSRFKSAEVLEVGPQGGVAATRQPSGVDLVTPEGTERTFEPAVAYRLIDAGRGRAALLHQYGFAGEIDIDHGDVNPQFPPVGPSTSDTPYGSAEPGSCGAIVAPSVSTLGADGVLANGVPLADAVLAVDTAVSPDHRWVAIAHAGTQDPAAREQLMNSGRLGDTFGALGGVTIHELGALVLAPPPGDQCHPPDFRIPVDGQVTAVGFDPRLEQGTPTAWLVVQTREPAQLVFFDNPLGMDASALDLGGESVLDTGHEIFHRNTGAGIACASCHAEGGDDGRVWHFTPLGPRRTQSVNVGLRDTEPFHWDGDMDDLGMLMNEVFVGRMGGLPQSDERLGALGEWLYGLKPPPPRLAAGHPSAVRGKALFESDAVGCAACHTGPSLTNSLSVEVGTTEPGHALQVPSLRGIGYRAPYIHDGCAPTLFDRFDPACGGDKHGETAHLSDRAIDDIVSYLLTL